MTASLPASLTGDFEALLVPVTSIEPNPDQPRQRVDQSRLAELTESVRARGRIIEPLVVRPVAGDRYEIICGERRWRAAVASGLTEVPVVVRRLSDDEAFEESLVENIDRDTMALIDEVRGVARVAHAHGVQAAARRLGKPHHWISKRKRIADAPPFVIAFLESDQSADVEAFYELAKLAEVDPKAAEDLVSTSDTAALRARVKEALRAARGGGTLDSETRSHANERDPDDLGESGDDAHAEPPSEDVEPEDEPGDSEARSERPRQASDLGFAGAEEDLSRRGRGDHAGAHGDEDEDDGGEPGAKAAPPWRSSDSTELDEPFDRDDAPIVVAVEARRAGHVVLRTARGAATYQFSEEARVQLRALLFPELPE